jgi:hypothetical protein
VPPGQARGARRTTVLGPEAVARRKGMASSTRRGRSTAGRPRAEYPSWSGPRDSDEAHEIVYANPVHLRHAGGTQRAHPRYISALAIRVSERLAYGPGQRAGVLR